VKAALVVLIVDDEPLLLRALVRMLRSDGIEAIGVANGALALEALADASFDLVLSDVRMPVMDGPTLLRHLRARGDAAPPLVFLTGYADDSDGTLLAAGAKAVCGKPTDPDELVTIVRRHARAPG